MSGARFADAEALIRGQQEEFTGDVAQRFMSPFQQAVIDIEKREAQQRFEQDVLPKVQAAAIQAGSFGGSRGAILEAEALRNQQQLLGDIQAKGLQSAFTQGQKLFEQQKARERGQAQALIGLSPAESAQRTRELQGLERVGAAQQAQTQTALDEAYKEFLEEQAFPETVLDRMQSAAFGFPALRSRVTQNPTTFGPSPFQTLATNVGAIGTGIGNLFGQLGGKTATGRKHGGVVSRRDGGLVPLVRRRTPGMTNPELGDPRGTLTPIPGPRGEALGSLRQMLRENRILQNVAAIDLKERQDAILEARQKRAEEAYQAKIDREQARRDPFNLGFNTTALFRMLSAAGRGDPEGPQLKEIGIEAQKISDELMATDEKLAAEDALRQETLQTAREDAELESKRQKFLRDQQRSKEDIDFAIKAEELDIEREKNRITRLGNILSAMGKNKDKIFTASDYAQVLSTAGNMQGLSYNEETKTLLINGDPLDPASALKVGTNVLSALEKVTVKDASDWINIVKKLNSKTSKDILSNIRSGLNEEERKGFSSKEIDKLKALDDDTLMRAAMKMTEGVLKKQNISAETIFNTIRNLDN